MRGQFVLGLGVGTLCATAATLIATSLLSPSRDLQASAVDRHQDFVMATGAVALGPKTQADGVWMLDYRAGKLLGTVIDKTQGKIVGWAEVDLVAEFEVAPRQDVHFMMVTGYITNGQAALYVAETTTGKFGVYTMGSGQNGGISVRRHDMTNFRKSPETATPEPKAPQNPVPAAPNDNLRRTGATQSVPTATFPVPPAKSK